MVIKGSIIRTGMQHKNSHGTLAVTADWIRSDADIRRHKKVRQEIDRRINLGYREALSPPEEIV